MQTTMQIKTRIRTPILVLFSILLLPALLFSPSIRATTLERLSLDQIAAGSDAVAHVRCTAAESRWENGSIWTLATVDVLESMKGSLPASITIRVPGGRV